MWNPYYLATILFCRMTLRELFHCKFYGEENIPQSGPFIVAANHLSHLDPPLIGAAFKSRELMFMARKTLFKPGFWNFLLSHINVIPVNKENVADTSAIRHALNSLKQGLGLVIFPEGTRSTDGQFGQAQPGLGFLACKSQTPVIPARIFGTYEILKKATLIPNIRQNASIVIDKPIFPDEYDQFKTSKQRYLETSQYICDRIQAIANPDV